MTFNPKNLKSRLNASRKQKLKRIREKALASQTALTRRVQAFLDAPMSNLPDGFSSETGTKLFSSGTYRNLALAKKLFENKFPSVYVRNGSPAADALFRNIVEYFDPAAIAGCVTGHGMGALSVVTSSLVANGKLKAGDEVVVANDVFAACYLILHELKNAGVAVHTVDGGNLQAWKAAISKNTKLVYLETPGNPGMGLIDLAAVCGLVRDHGHPGALIVADISLEYVAHTKEMSVFKHGVHIVVASLSKSLGLGSDNGGLVYMSEEGRDRLRDLPRHSVKIVKGSGDAVTTELREIPDHEPSVNILLRHMARHGHIIAPRVAFRLLENLIILEQRYALQSESAKILAQHIFDNHPHVRVLSPGLAGNPQADLVKRQMKGGIVFSIDVGTFDNAERFTGALIKHGCKLINNFGSVATTVAHPAGTTHSALTDEERRKQGIGPGIVRVSVGVEDIELIRGVFDLALGAIAPEAAAKKSRNKASAA